MKNEQILATVKEIDPLVSDLISREDDRQLHSIRMIPSENYASPAVRAALASNFTNKYGEGYPGRRYYQGQVNTDALENEVLSRAKALFGYPFANVQALSGAPANLAVYTAFLQPNSGKKIMAMRLDHGGHLTHGSPVSVTGQWYQFKHYGCNEKDVLDMDEIRRMALEFKPDVLVCGYTAYPRTIDFAAFGAIAKEVGAISFADISHIAGLVAGGAHPSPFPHIDIVTFTTHKTLRGPRAAIILSKDAAHAEAIDKALFPGLQGGPHFNTIAAIGVSLKEAATPAFKEYSRRIVANARALAAALVSRGYHVSSGGTDNHLLLVDVRKSRGLPGKRAAVALEEVNIELNFNTVPNASESQKPLFPDGIRMGTPAITTRGMKEADMAKVAEFIDRALKLVKTGKLAEGESMWSDAAAKDKLAAEVSAFAAAFPMFAY
jgi:glycine hydroxymethyltransferase